MAKRLRERSISDPQPSQGESGVAVHTSKLAQLDMPGEKAVTMQCSLPPHKTLTFSSYAEYETHYTKLHTDRCHECSKNFPSAHLLSLHQAENHDPIMAMKREQGEKIYACFVEGCEKVCSEWQKRRSHLVDKHCYPRNYDFLVVQTGIDGKRSMLRAGVDSQGHRRSSRDRRGSSATLDTQTTEATSISQHSDGLGEEVEAASKLKQPVKKEDATLGDITKSMSSLQFVPRSVTFGKRKGKSGFAKS